MNNIKKEVEKIEIPRELHKRVEMGVKKAQLEKQSNLRNFPNETIEDDFTLNALTIFHLKRRTLYKKISIIAVICLIIIPMLSFTPVLAAIQEAYDKIFSSKHIDDEGVRNLSSSGRGQLLNQTFYDEKHGITVHFDSVVTDDKETKILLTYQSNKTNLKNFYIDLFEGKSSVNLVVNNQKKQLKSVGWGSRYYDRKENKVAEALSFQSIKKYKEQNIHLDIKDLTIYDNNSTGVVQTRWPLNFKLEESGISKRETVVVSKDFAFEKERYHIKQVEFSDLETRVVVSGTDIKQYTDENGIQYEVRSKLENKLMNARKVDKDYGYVVNEKKSGVFLSSDGKKINPVFSKGEVQGEDDEYIMIFAPVKDRQNCFLEIGENVKIPLVQH